MKKVVARLTIWSGTRPETPDGKADGELLMYKCLTEPEARELMGASTDESDAWQEVECPVQGTDFDLSDESMVCEGDTFHCSECWGEHVATADIMAGISARCGRRATCRAAEETGEHMKMTQRIKDLIGEMMRGVAVPDSPFERVGDAFYLKFDGIEIEAAPDGGARVAFQWLGQATVWLPIEGASVAIANGQTVRLSGIEGRQRIEVTTN